MASSTNESYERLIGLIKQMSLLRSTASLLAWDQETMMPPKGLALRSDQLAQLARMTHEMLTDPKVGELLAECEADDQWRVDPLDVPAVNLREIRRAYDRATALPCSLVEQLARTSAIARAEWGEARRDDDFAHFRPWLEKLVDLIRQRFRVIGFDGDDIPGNPA